MGANMSTPLRSFGQAVTGFMRQIPGFSCLPGHSLRRKQSDTVLYLRIWAEYLILDNGNPIKRQMLLFEDLFLSEAAKKENSRRIYHISTCDADKNKTSEMMVITGPKSSDPLSCEYFIFWRNRKANNMWRFDFISSSGEEGHYGEESFVDVLKTEIFGRTSSINNIEKCLEQISEDRDFCIPDSTKRYHRITEYNFQLDKLLDVLLIKDEKRDPWGQDFSYCIDLETGDTWESKDAEPDPVTGSSSTEKGKRSKRGRDQRFTRNIGNAVNIWTKYFKKIKFAK